VTTPRSAQEPETPLARDLLFAARYYLGGRRGLFILAGLAIAMGLALNWSWLAAAGIAPILVGLLPCLAMCAFGLCMNRAGSESCSTVAKTSNRAAVDDTEPVTEAAAFEAPPESAAPELPISGEAAPPASPKPQTPKERTPTDA